MKVRSKSRLIPARPPAQGQATKDIIIEMEGQGCDVVEDGFWEDIERAAYGPFDDPSHEGNDYPDALQDLDERSVVLSG